MVSLFDNCPACRGTRQIEVQMMYSVQICHSDEPPAYVPPDVKRYPCPECQSVFYKSDLVHTNVQLPLREQFKDEPGYVDHLENDIARRLGQLALSKDAVSFRPGKDMDMSYYGYRQHIGTMYVVKNTAQGWKK